MSVQRNVSPSSIQMETTCAPYDGVGSGNGGARSPVHKL